MDQQTYLDELRFHLAGRMPVNEVERVLQYYAREFAAAQQGAEAVAVNLGDPKKLADDLIDDYLNLKSEYDRRHQKPKKRRFGLLNILAVVAVVSIGSNLAFSLMRPRYDYGRAPSETMAPMAAEQWAPPAGVDYGRSLISIPGQENLSHHPIIHSVNIHVDSAHVEIVAGNEYSVMLFVPEGRAAFDAYYDNGTVTIDRTEGYSATGPGWPRIVITVPQDSMFENFSISNSYGNLTMDGIGVKGELYYYSDFGSLTLTNNTIGSLNTTLSAGSTTLTGVTVLESGWIQLSAGKVHLNGCNFSVLDIYNDIGAIVGERIKVSDYLNAHTEIGEIWLGGDLSGSIYANSAMGKVTVNTTLPEEAYYMNISTSTGAVNIDGAKQRGSYFNWGEGSYSMDLYTDIGDINLNFRAAMPEERETGGDDDTVYDLDTLKDASGDTQAQS